MSPNAMISDENNFLAGGEEVGGYAVRRWIAGTRWDFKYGLLLSGNCWPPEIKKLAFYSF